MLITRILLRPLDLKDEEGKETRVSDDSTKNKDNRKTSSESYINIKLGISKLENLITLEGITDFVSTKPNFLARMFMCYDCQPYSSDLAIKLIECMSKISQNKFNVDTEK